MDLDRGEESDEIESFSKQRAKSKTVMFGNTWDKIKTKTTIGSERIDSSKHAPFSLR